MMAVIVPVYRYFNKKITALINLNKIARKFRLIFSAKDVIAGNVIALDADRKKLVYIKNWQSNASCMVIDLNSVEHCSIQTKYSDINAGELHGRKLSDFLNSIYLRLRFRNQKNIITLPLFEDQAGGEDRSQAESKARLWQSQITRLLPALNAERA